MTVRIRDRRYYASCDTQAYIAATMAPYGVLHSDGESMPMGFYQSIDQAPRIVKYDPKMPRLNPVTIRKSYGTRSPGEYMTARPDAGYLYYLHGVYGSCFYFTPVYGIWDANLARYSFEKANAKLLSAKHDYGELVGELDETIRLLRNPVKALTDFMKLVKRGRYWDEQVEGLSNLITRLSAKKNALKQIPVLEEKLKRAIDAREKIKHGIAVGDLAANGWLTYRYGICPLVSDIQMIIDHFTKNVEDKMRPMYSKKALIKTVSKSTWNSGNLGYHSFDARSRKTIELEVISSSHFYYRKVLEASYLQKLRSVGFHPQQLPKLAWELTRYSFVVDWILSVGNWIATITPKSNLELLGNATSQKTKYTVTIEDLNISSSLGLRMNKPGKCTWVSETLIRQVNSATPLIPAYNPNFLNIKRSLDTLSLLWRPLVQSIRR